ncbi:MAG: hypothetical protein JO250_21870 [Armatimonadetes bacterium]|nr:hypothetical protein [Armatimonadota bacterium]
MSRLHVFAEHIAAPNVATALREHREDRDVLLARLKALLQEDPRVRAVWLWGSSGRGDADDLSDLDPWVIVADDAVPEMGAALTSLSVQAGELVSAGEAPQNAPPGGGYLGALHAGRHGLLHVDWYWQPLSAVTVMPPRAVLLYRLPGTLPVGDWKPITAGQPARDSTDPRAQIKDSLGFLWLMLSIAAKWLARDPASDLALMLYPRPGFEEAITQLGLSQTFLPLDWSVPERPQDKVAQLRSLVLTAQHVTAEAIAQGCALSPLYAPCLHQYLDLVAGIVADKSPSA